MNINTLMSNEKIDSKKIKDFIVIVKSELKDI